MRIEIWSDVVCPWCYIGKRRLETALASFGHADEVELVFRSFELDPTAPREAVESVAETLGRKYGGGVDAGRQMIAQVSEVAAAEGLAFDYADTLRSNTSDAHRLLHLALEVGGPRLQARLKEALLEAHFCHARSMGDHAVLREVATGAGLDPSRVAEVLTSDAFAEAVEADVDEARAYGATGVPFFVIDRRYAVSGAQPAEVFGQALRQAWSDAHPSVQRVGGPDGDGVCGPDGCTV